MRRAKTTSSAGAHALWLTVALFTIVIPLYVSPHADNVFRLPKDLLVRAEAICILAIVALMLIRQPDRWRDFRIDRRTGLALGSVVVAMIIATVFSTNRSISIRSASEVVASMVAFWGAYIVAGNLNLPRAILVGSASAIPNAVLAISQRLDWFNPFEFPEWLPHRMRITAFIGNPNDVGASLAVCFIPVAVAALHRRNPAYIATAAVVLCGVLASDAATAMLAVSLGLAVVVLTASRRVRLPVIAAMVLIGAATVLLFPPLRARGRALIASARARDYDALTSHRIVPFLVALKIFEDHPLTGAGPGTFKWLYLPYRLRVEADYPSFYLKSTENVGAVHSDHLQILAEEGLIGYAALWIAVVTISSRWWMLRKANGEQDERAKFVHLAALPLAICFLMLAATGFPLELAAVTTPLLFFVACLSRWSNDAKAS
jgi:O-antigen ligase